MTEYAAYPYTSYHIWATVMISRPMLRSSRNWSQSCMPFNKIDLGTFSLCFMETMVGPRGPWTINQNLECIRHYYDITIDFAPCITTLISVTFYATLDFYLPIQEIYGSLQTTSNREVLVSPPLNAMNYHTWSAMFRATWSKNKLEFVDGSLPMLNKNDVNHKA
ncbi:hypothetical protein CR513_47902, partial [Mucuna pruriens]